LNKHEIQFTGYLIEFIVVETNNPLVVIYQSASDAANLRPALALREANAERQIFLLYVLE